MAATRHDTGGLPVIARPGLFHARMGGVSGVVFVVLFAVGLSDVPAPAPDIARALSSVGYSLVFVYGVQAVVVYLITTTGLTGPVGVIPRRLAAASYVVATFLLVSATFHPAILLVFPAWVLMLSALLAHRPIGETP